MLPNQLAAASFGGYPAAAKRLAVSQIALLRRLPLGFVPLLLKELIVYDWKFPAERKEIDRQFAYLTSLAPEELAKAMAAFSQLRLTSALEKTDWVNSPAVFTEQLTAHLSTTHQIDAFRAAAVDYVGKSSAAAPDDPLPTHRLGIVVIGQGVRNNQYRLFRKLRPQGVYFTQVRLANGFDTLAGALAKRAALTRRLTAIGTSMEAPPRRSPILWRVCLTPRLPLSAAHCRAVCRRSTKPAYSIRRLFGPGWRRRGRMRSDSILEGTPY